MAESTDPEHADTYDEEASAVNWRGPLFIFGMMADIIQPRQTVLDLGIGTGLGSEPFSGEGLRITGLDRSESMLAICKKKGIATLLVRHDLTEFPYPFSDQSFDHVISTGVLHFFPDLDRIFKEVARILARGGRFAFITGDRTPEESAEIIAGPEQTGTDTSVIMYLHSPQQITDWLERNSMHPEDSFPFTIWMDAGRSKSFPARAYRARKLGIQPGDAPLELFQTNRGQ
jgi:predicted TPR repeat methyltransferase